MNVLFFVRVCLIAVVLSSTNAFAALLFEYSVKQYPPQGRTCDANAAWIGSKFADATGLPVFRAACASQTATGHDVLIVYQAAAPVSLVSTGAEMGHFNSYLGIYKNRQDCDAALNDEVTGFTNATGLEPVLAYCYRQSLGDTPYAVRIDALGEATVRPYRYQHTVFGTVMAGQPDPLSKITDAGRGAGINVYRVAFANDGLENLVIRFFDSTENVALRSRYFDNDLIAVHSYQGAASNCLAQRQSLELAFNERLATPAVFFCVWDEYLFQASLYAVRVRPYEMLGTEQVPGARWTDFNACVAEKARTLTMYREQLGRDPLAAACTWDTDLADSLPDAYVMTMFFAF